jgi:rhomboid protease GluP
MSSSITGQTIDIQPDPPAKQSLRERSVFYLSTWSGRIILVNACVFVLMTLASRSLFMPSEAVLLAFGAKDPTLIAEGQWWRLITPIFVHIGLIHFLFNSYALRSIGPQIQSILSPGWFLLIYLVSGIAGNVASNGFNLRLSAGASGAIFGLIGSGLVIENYLKKYLIRSGSPYRANQAYTSLAILNIVFGLLVPGIDNAAHLGGLFGGVVLTIAQLRIRENRMVTRKPWVGYALITFFLAAGAVVTSISMDKDTLGNRFAEEGDAGFLKYSSAEEREDKIDGARESYHQYTSALKLNPDDAILKFKRGRLLILVGETSDGIKDLSLAAVDPAIVPLLSDLVKQLQSEGRGEDAAAVALLIKP